MTDVRLRVSKNPTDTLGAPWEVTGTVPDEVGDLMWGHFPTHHEAIYFATATVSSLVCAFPCLTPGCEASIIVTRYGPPNDLSCRLCDAEYNAFGQRLRDNWRDNPSNWDESVSDMDGYEDAMLWAERDHP